MVSKLNLFSSSLLVIVFLFGGNLDVTEGIEAELKMYFDSTLQSDYITFKNPHANLDFYSALFGDLKMACGNGEWTAFPEVNFQGEPTFLGSTQYNDERCYAFDGSKTKSIRHIGDRNTWWKTLSLYAKPNYTGREIAVSGTSQIGIITPVKSIGGTGNPSQPEEWTLFEGWNLNGKSACITVPTPGHYYYLAHDVTELFNLTTIGSVIRGPCNATEIQQH